MSWKLRCAVAGGLRGRTAAFFLAEALAEEAAEEFFGEQPVVAVDAVLHLRRLHFALYESCRLEFLEVLRHGGLGNGQLFVDVAEIAGFLPGQELQDGDAGRMAHGLRKPGQLLLPNTVRFVCHNLEFVRVGRGFYLPSPQRVGNLGGSDISKPVRKSTNKGYSIQGLRC